MLFRSRSKGLKRSSIKSYWMAISKLFNKFKKLKLIKLDNPMQEVELPKDGKMTRDRVPSIDEVSAILTALDNSAVKSHRVSPTSAIVRFALFTGARIGEILHAEWGDFDISSGYWCIKNKPVCPGIEGIGWYPKWRKERAVKLFPEALAVLDELPRVKSTGVVKDDFGNEMEISANFVFAKKTVKIEKDCRMKRKKGYFNCARCSEHSDIYKCSSRQINFSRCDSIKKAWGTIKEKAGIEDLYLHDLRRFFNRVILQEKLGFSPEESGRYIGNTEEVNRDHYSPISIDVFERKINKNNFSELIGG